MHVDKSFADRAPELWTTQFRKLMADYGSVFIPGPPHHSQTQGFVERANRTIQDSIAKNLRGSEHKWSDFLKPIVQAYRHTVHTSTGHTPFFMMHGWEPPPPPLSTLIPPADSEPPIDEYVSSLRQNIQSAWDSAARNLSKYHEKSRRRLNKSRRDFKVPLGSLVYVRIPPNKGQSQGFQSFNSGLWKLLSFDNKSNKCTVKTTADGVTRTEDVHAQYIFPFTGTQQFKPAFDYDPAVTPNTPSVPTLAPHPHQKHPRRRGRPRKKASPSALQANENHSRKPLNKANQKQSSRKQVRRLERTLPPPIHSSAPASRPLASAPRRSRRSLRVPMKFRS